MIRHRKYQLLAISYLQVEFTMDRIPVHEKDERRGSRYKKRYRIIGSLTRTYEICLSVIVIDASPLAIGNANYVTRYVFYVIIMFTHMYIRFFFQTIPNHTAFKNVYSEAAL